MALDMHKQVIDPIFRLRLSLLPVIQMLEHLPHAEQMLNGIFFRHCALCS